MVRRIKVLRRKQSLDIRPDCFNVFHICHLCRLACSLDHRRYLLHSPPLLHSRELEGMFYLPFEIDSYRLTLDHPGICLPQS